MELRISKEFLAPHIEADEGHNFSAGILAMRAHVLAELEEGCSVTAGWIDPEPFYRQVEERRKSMSTHPRTRAKFYVNSVTHDEYGGLVKMTAVHDSTINTEDNAFNAATPSGTLEMRLSGKERAKFFTPGEKYYLDFTLVEDPKV